MLVLGGGIGVAQTRDGLGDDVRELSPPSHGGRARPFDVSGAQRNLPPV